MMAYEATGILPEMLAEQPEAPRNGIHVWAWFLELHQARGGNGFGPSPISFRDLRDWTEMTRTRPEPWEVRAILKIDQAYLNAMADEMRKEAKR